MKIISDKYERSRRGDVKHFIIWFNAISIVLLIVLLTSCEKDFEIDIKANQTQLVVEGYINNEMREMNYVVLTRSLDYYSPDFQSTAVSGAVVTITEGDFNGNGSYTWDTSTKLELREANLPQIPSNFRQGVYFDPRLVTDSANALIGRTGKYYLLEIETSGKNYSAITYILEPVTIDSLTCGFSFTDMNDDNREKARVTIHFQDPDTLGNSQLFYWRDKGNRNNFGWGGIGSTGRNYGVDDLSNGEYLHVTQNRPFEIGDTVSYYMASVTRDIYDFWENFRDARNNEGPFSTPVTLLNKIEGEAVTGCFSGFSLSSKSVVIYK
ncbi:MAG: DUF4249 domain-containing protein [Chitinophagaceae bacterium]